MSKVTTQQITEWKQKHGEIFKITVDGKEAYLRKPDRKILSYVTSMASNEPLKFNEILLNNCWLGGDTEIKTDDTLFLSASAKLGQLIEIKSAELVKL